MEFRQLRYFARVAETGSVSKAAAALAVAQPAISRHISQLEEEFGTPLFYRNGRGVSLTEAGEVLLERTRSILDEIRRAEEDVRAVIGIASGAVTLGTPPTVGQVFVVPLITRLRQVHPNLSLEVAEAFSGYVNEWLANGALDVAVLYDAPRTRHLVTEELLTEELYHVSAGPGTVDPSRYADPAREPEPTDLAALAHRPLVLPRRPHGLRLLIDRSAQDAQVELDILFELDSLSITKELVAAGVADTVLPFAAVHQDVIAGRMSARRVVNPSLTRTLVLATSSQRPLTVSTRAVVAELKSVMRDLVDGGTWRGARPRPKASDPRG